MNMPEKVTLLVIGVGGNVGQGILKALAHSTLGCRIVGACVEARSMGLYVCDYAVISPYANDPRFVDWLVETCLAHKVQGVLSGVEPVLTVLAKHQAEIEKRTGARILVSPSAKLAICDDKLCTAEWLRDNGLNYPRSADAQDVAAVRRLVDECGLHLFAKPRLGKGSHGVMEIKSEADLSLAVQQPGYVIQEYLGDPDHEFTAATFTDRDGKVRGCIVFQRYLLHGTTVFAQVVDVPAVDAEVLAISKALRPTGPCNIQLRLVNDRALCFEINLRYSGTTPVRAQLGFNAVEAGVRHFILGKPAVDLPRVRQGAALRFWNEVYISPEALENCIRNAELSDPKSAIEHLEDFGNRA